MKKRILILSIIAIFAFAFNVNAANTIKEENGHKYCVNENGEIQVGAQVVNGKTYFFSRATNIYGQMKYGWQDDGTNKFYLDEKTGELYKGLFTYKNNKYYANDQGYIQVGAQVVNGKTYFFSRATNIYGQMKYGWQYDGINRFYLDDNSGELYKGLFTYKNNKYYANDQGYIQVGAQAVNGKTYFFSRANNIYGQMKYGWQDNGINKFYLDETTGELYTGLFTYKNNKYYANDQGFILVGLQTVDGKTYFFSRANNIFGQMKYGWQDNGINKFYLDEKTGELYTGLFTYKNNKYYANDQGFILVGQQTIDGKTYFFSRATNTFGQMKYGMQDDGINKFYLDEKTGELIKGQFEYNNDKYYANDQGYIQGGFITIEGKKYFYSRAKGNNFGKLKYGWSNAPEGYWYQDNEGALVTGAQHVDARDYIFSNEGFVQGFKIENGKKYYYDPDGTKVKGVQRMCGTYMMFNSLTGAYEKNVNQKRVIDISVHNGNVDWEKVKESGLVDGVILRSSFGVGYIDGKFERNVNELNRLGIPYSVYHFSYAENKAEAKREADYLISVLKKYPVRINSNMFSIYYDLEDWEISSTGENSYGIKPNTYKEMITTFASTVQNATGIKVRVYASKNYIETRFPKEVQGYATWVAQWSDYITYKGPYEGWQYTSTGKVPGINGNVDMSIFYY